MKTTAKLLLSFVLLLLPACGSAFSVDGLAAPADEDAGPSGTDSAPNPERDAGQGPESAPVGEDAHGLGERAVEAAAVDRDGGAADGMAGDAPVEAGDAPSNCVNDLSDVGAGDFHIEFDVVGGASGGPLVEQRASCGQYNVEWIVAETASGNINTWFYDGSTGFGLQSVGTVDDGAKHHVVVARVTLLFSITIDGQLDTSIANAVWAPPTLPLLQVGRSACTTPFTGQITGACVTRP